MTDEDALLLAIQRSPTEDTPRLVYADWLDEHDDFRADFVRLHVGLKAAAPDHIDRVAAEHELSYLRKGFDPAWLAVIEPERLARATDPTHHWACRCLDAAYSNQRWPELYLHSENQDTECDGWKRLLDLVEQAAADGREEFSPLLGMTADERAQILTLPASVAKLKAVKVLNLYGSNLVRVPPEVGEMASLEEFYPYTSYRLHWLPFELTRCRNLKDSTVSTRALYGNLKYRPPFPRSDPGAEVAPGRVEADRLPVKRLPRRATRPCSVCGEPFVDERRHRVWVSLRVATDVLPMLVNACSEACVGKLPTPSDRYVRQPHRGGLEVQQPPREY